MSSLASKHTGMLNQFIRVKKTGSVLSLGKSCELMKAIVSQPKTRRHLNPL